MKNVLVACFSASGRTKKAGLQLAKAVGADFYEIKPKTPYSKEDLDWTNKKSRSSVEMSDKSGRPPLADNNAEIGKYNTVFLGFPIWWYVAPTIINTFLESYDFSGKKVILFATSGGSGFGKTVANLKNSVPDSTELIEGRPLNGRESDQELRTWAESLI